MSEAVALRPEPDPSAASSRPLLYARPNWAPHRRRRLDRTKLPRVPGLDHGSAEGYRYREACLALMARCGLTGPPPEAILPSLREVGVLTLALDRLALAEAAEQCGEARQQILRGLRSEQRRTRSQLRTHERIVLAIAAELHAEARQSPPSAASLLDRVGR